MSSFDEPVFGLRADPRRGSGSLHESLQAVNGTRGIEGVLLRLASPKEYRGDADVTRKVIDYLNQVLLVEGLEITLVGINARIQDRTAAVAPPKPKDRPVETAPNFARLVADSSLADILSFRWEEAQRCIQAEAYLSAVIMMGSILEVGRFSYVLARATRGPRLVHGHPASMTSPLASAMDSSPTIFFQKRFSIRQGSTRAATEGPSTKWPTEPS